METFKDANSMVIEYGSRMIKCGFSGDDAPRAVFPSIVGRACKSSMPVMVGMDRKNTMVGDEASAKMGVFDTYYPINNGEVENWKDFQEIVHHTYYNELRVCPEDQPSFISICPSKDDITPEKIVKLHFDEFNTPKLFFHSVPALLAMLASQKKKSSEKKDYSGIVLDVGETTTHCVCISEGKYLPQTLQKTKLGGRDITKFLIKKMKEARNKGNINDFSKYPWQHEVARDIKEKKCYVSENIGSEGERSNEDETTEYTLEDGRQVIIPKHQLYGSTEILFQPRLFDEIDGMLGVTELIKAAVEECPYDVNKQDMYQNIVLSGSSTKFAGFPERLESDLKRIVYDTQEIKVKALPERSYLTWIGGSILSSLTAFQELWVSQDVWKEEGFYAIKRRCSERLFLDGF